MCLNSLPVTNGCDLKELFWATPQVWGTLPKCGWHDPEQRGGRGRKQVACSTTSLSNATLTIYGPRTSAGGRFGSREI